MLAGFNTVLIVGLGLIGGSIAGAVKSKAPGTRIIGIDVDAEAVRQAQELGLIDEGITQRVGTAGVWTVPSFAGLIVPSFADLTAQSFAGLTGESTEQRAPDLIILATPAGTFENWFRLIAATGYTGLITDTASTKSAVIGTAKRILPDSKNFIPGHPMAGSEAGGIAAARSDLFEGAYWILTPDADTDPQQFGALHGFIAALGARPITVDPAEHDKAVAIISHIPHIAASSLVALAGKHSGEHGELLRLAAGGFKDTTRIAAGDPDLWTGIVTDNADVIADELKELIGILSDYEEKIRTGEKSEIRRNLAEAADLRKTLPAAKWVPATAKLIEMRIPMGNRPGIIAEITAAAGRMGCNIMAIEIDHLTERRAILDLVLSDEGNMQGFVDALTAADYAPQISEQ
ncbi:MAG: prephenate dehydrogenase/arogenate dehydrogenase family protein [Clostridiales Family XIII bacterium]|jgi:prephenate dehydrogenase|nr:prephenate dehydrogenase/arogenate dehydrogenase family protein [Clostridiales Family XIII bacterium]